MIFVYILLGIIGGFLLFYVIPTFLISYIIYSSLLIRHNKDEWGRHVSWDDEEQKRMFYEGEEWGKENEEYHKTVSIVNEGFKLVGEYFDFGYDRCVIVIAGRMEAGTYSYYFSNPYKEGKFNVLAIDNRSHGESDGRYNCLGLKEYSDIIAWAKYLHDNENIKKMIIHGICIGCATGLYALLQDNTPDYMVGLIADGMYESFAESFKNHLKERNKPLFPYTQEVMFYIRLASGKDPIKYSPTNLISKLDRPILFLYSKEDTYSTPTQANTLYEKCTSKKQLVWFDKGVHSHLRINASEKYDRVIKEFLKDNFD